MADDDARATGAPDPYQASAVARLLDELAEEARAPRERPGSTYRLQLTPRFSFRAAAALVPYLARLGVTHVYLSPILAAAPGSSHGYDVIDHHRLNPELGGEEGFAALTEALRAHGLRAIVDFVPNHMAIEPNNAWWTDLLENGQSSLFAPYFDVDWHPAKAELENKVLVPVLGDQFGEVLERGELRLERDGGAFSVRYFEHRFPISPRSVPRILRHGLEALEAELGPSDEHVMELQSIIASLEKLAPRSKVDPDKIAERAREKEVAKRRLAALFDESPRIRAFVDANLAQLNGTPGDPRSFDLLASLLDAQAYRLAHWRVAGEEINYRRFFDINSLAAIRMEDERVFADTHRLVLGLLRDGRVHGLRIDHPDGLYQPTAYFRSLQRAGWIERARARFLARGGAEVDFEALVPALGRAIDRAVAEGRLPPRSLYVVVEKILEGRERMPASWCVDGTTGYEALFLLTALFVDGRSEGRFSELYARFTGRALDYTALVDEKKRLLMSTSMASELQTLAHRLNRISERDRRTRDFTLGSLRRALVEYVAALPIYRTYVEGTAAADVTDRDHRAIEGALARAARHTPDLNRSIYRFLGDILLLRHPERIDEAQRHERVELVRKLQQVTGPVTAKAVEDTAYYVYNRLVALNEVGGDPRCFGIDEEEFHARNAERLEKWPGSLTATATHDTKRGEDLRLRIAALSEIPDRWEAAVHRWAELNRRAKVETESGPAPDPNDEILLYQTLVGAFPDETPAPHFAGRICDYMQKALKEAKVHTSWTNPDEEYEAAVRRFVEDVLCSRAFLDDFVPFQRRIAHAARLSSLAMAALKLASPGVADVYQGCELWDLSLVDPDNRRPVDFQRRARLLDELERRLGAGPRAREPLAREVSRPEALVDGRAKLLLLREGLRWRRTDPALFLDGDYVPLAVDGDDAHRVVALARGHEGRALVCVVPRLVLDALDERGGLALRARVLLPETMAGPFVDAVSGRRVVARDGALRVEECWAAFPVALLGARSDEG